LWTTTGAVMTSTPHGTGSKYERIAASIAHHYNRREGKCPYCQAEWECEHWDGMGWVKEVTREMKIKYQDRLELSEPFKIAHVNPNCTDSTRCKPHGEVGPVFYNEKED
jgi:hypothetical protein